MDFETIKTEPKQEIMVNKEDLKFIDDTINKIKEGKIEKNITLKEYNENQIKEAKIDPNRQLTMMEVGKDEHSVSDEELIVHFIKEDKYGFSLAFRYALRNQKFRKDLTDDQLIHSYKIARKKIEFALNSVDNKSIN